jgi:hypothetical protein
VGTRGPNLSVTRSPLANSECLSSVCLMHAHIRGVVRHGGPSREACMLCSSCAASKRLALSRHATAAAALAASVGGGAVRGWQHVDGHIDRMGQLWTVPGGCFMSHVMGCNCPLAMWWACLVVAHAVPLGPCVGHAWLLSHALPPGSHVMGQASGAAAPPIRAGWHTAHPHLHHPAVMQALHMRVQAGGGRVWE